MTVSILEEEPGSPEKAEATKPKTYTLQRIEGFAARDLELFVPVPNHKLESKFRWFYRPYCYQANTAKYMDFSSDGSSEDEFSHYNHPAFTELACSPWTHER